jgi:hypothetical protein
LLDDARFLYTDRFLVGRDDELRLRRHARGDVGTVVELVRERLRSVGDAKLR